MLCERKKVHWVKGKCVYFDEPVRPISTEASDDPRMNLTCRLRSAGEIKL